MKIAIILAALLASGSAMAQSAPHGDSGAIGYAKQWYAQNGMGNFPHGNSSGLSCAAFRDICSFAGTCDAHDCPEPNGTRAEVQHTRLQSCMVELSTIADGSLRRWCETQSKRLP